MSLYEDGGLSEYLNEDHYNDDNDLPDGSEENPFGADEENLEELENAKPSTSGVKVEPKKRSVRNPKPRLTIQLLRGEKGIHTIEDYFKGFKSRGKGYEREDLDEIMERLQSWSSCLYPLDTFDTLLDTIERLNKKRELQTHMARYRAGLLESMKLSGDKEANLLDDGFNGNGGLGNADGEPFDEMDALLDQQIAMSMIAENNSQKPSSSATSLSNRFDKLNSSRPLNNSPPKQIVVGF